MTTFSSTIDANSFQANDLLEKGERRSVRGGLRLHAIVNFQLARYSGLGGFAIG
jgi:hypothetical protein